MNTIGFFGDSFCADHRQGSWCNLFAEKIGCGAPVCYGREGDSIWGTFTKFNKRISEGTVPNISVFCWTEPYRMYHSTLPLTINIKQKSNKNSHLHQALDDYWKYLQCSNKDELAYEYALKYYDRHVLSTIDKKIIQTWSFRPFENSDKDAGIGLQTGLFIDKSLYRTAADEKSDSKEMNHMSANLNEDLANYFYGITKEYLQQ